jgi:hypothetical protein
MVICEQVHLSRKDNSGVRLQAAGAAMRPAILMIMLAALLLGPATMQAQVPADQLAKPRTVMMGGKLMDADALREASGFSGRPKPAE